LSDLAEITRSWEAGHGFVADGPGDRSASSEVYAHRFVVQGDGFFVEWQMDDTAPPAKSYPASVGDQLRPL
jgi:hypothetical protein